MAAGLPDWLALDEATGELTIAAGATDDPEVGFYTLVVTATDPDGETAMHTLLLTISDDPDDGTVTDPAPDGTDSNSPPTLTDDAPTAMAPLTANEGEAATWTLSDWFEDPDTGDTLTYTLSDEPDWLELDDSNGELTIAAEATDDADVDSHVFVITASDDDGEEATLTVTLTVANVAEAPVTTTLATASLTVAEAAAAAWTISGWFSDPDGDTLTYTGMELQGAAGSQTAMALPTWLVLDAMTGALTIAAAATDDAQVGVYTVAITASDTTTTTALTASHTVTVEVTNVNDAPTAASAPAMLTAMEGSPTANSWDVSTWFSDEDAATNSPMWRRDCRPG